MESDTKRRERDLAEHQQRMDKIDLLQKSLEDAKAQRRKLMESTKEELQRNKERDDMRTKEIAKLKLEGTKRDAESKKWRDDAASKAVRCKQGERASAHYRSWLWLARSRRRSGCATRLPA